MPSFTHASACRDNQRIAANSGDCKGKSFGNSTVDLFFENKLRQALSILEDI